MEERVSRLLMFLVTPMCILMARFVSFYNTLFGETCFDYTYVRERKGFCLSSKGLPVYDLQIGVLLNVWHYSVTIS